MPIRRAPRGSRLAAQNDVVVVTVNQRLNIFGHLDLSAFGGEAFRLSGNAGTLDMVASLEWVRDNIAAFGGDPGNVTIFGESGGGAKVSTLLAMPRAKGLFHRAIIQSGAAVRLRTKERALALTECVLRHLGSAAATVDALQAVPVEHLLAAVEPAQQALGPSPTPLFDRYPFGPVVDGDVLPAQPFDPVASDVCADVPLIIGDMKTETTNFLAIVDQVWDRSLTEAEMRQRVEAIAGEHAGRVIELYGQLYPGLNPAERLIAITTDSNFRIRSLVLAQRRAALKRGPVWMYSFEWETPVLGGKLKSPHAMDVPFVFNTLDLTNATGGSAGRAGAGGHDVVGVGGVRPQRPAGSSRRSRPGRSTTPTNRATLMLDKVCRIENDPRGEARRLWQDITGTVYRGTRSMQVQTVTGPIGLDQLGRTLMHEHLFIAFPGAEFDPSAQFDRAGFVAEAVRRLTAVAHRTWRAQLRRSLPDRTRPRRRADAGNRRKIRDERGLHHRLLFRGDGPAGLLARPDGGGNRRTVYPRDHPRHRHDRGQGRRDQGGDRRAGDHRAGAQVPRSRLHRAEGDQRADHHPYAGRLGGPGAAGGVRQGRRARRIVA